MSPENTQKLKDIFPEAFTDLDIRTPMALFGFQCDDGWFNLLHDLLSEIKGICVDHSSWSIRIAQVKEKYGALRFYYDLINPDYICAPLEEEDRQDIKQQIDDAILWAEVRSVKECETCGKPATMRGKGWFYFSCDDCEANRK